MNKCAKFRGSRAIMGLAVLVLSCHCAFVGMSWVEKKMYIFSIPLGTLKLVLSTFKKCFRKRMSRKSRKFSFYF